MRPTLSVIFFTVLSGMGYGLLFLLGLGLLVRWPYLASSPGHKDGPSLTLFIYPYAINYGLLVGLVLVSAGLFASLTHLGQPRRAWRALSQWRSSWLSREGIAAIVSYIPALGLIIVFWLPVFWHPPESAPLFWPLPIQAPCPLGAALAVMAFVTVYCTSGIYTSLKTIHAWHNRYVLPGYLLFALLGGSSCLWMLQTLIGSGVDPLLRRGLPLLIVALALIGVVLKHLYWRFIDTTQHPATVESATGLGRFGAVRSVEAPHTEENYLTREMGFVLARKHSARLRGIALILFGVAPIIFAIAALMWPAAGYLCACFAFVVVTAGIFVERWLFFAEARHVVMLYYHAPARA
jgi:sulfite dehydrogenase (quinone) subunit SoeC